MQVKDVRNILYTAVAKFFTNNATVIWTEQVGTKPKAPFVTLKLGDVTRESFPIKEDGIIKYCCKAVFEINLQTNGIPVKVGNKITSNHVNTATSDLTDLANFLESESMVDFFYSYDLNLSLMGVIRDLSTIEKETAYNYRAMAEFEVNFMLDASGMNAIPSTVVVPNASGGGSEALKEDISIIEQVELGGLENEE